MKNENKINKYKLSALLTMMCFMHTGGVDASNSPRSEIGHSEVEALIEEEVQRQAISRQSSAGDVASIEEEVQRQAISRQSSAGDVASIVDAAQDLFSQTYALDPKTAEITSINDDQVKTGCLMVNITDGVIQLKWHGENGFTIQTKELLPSHLIGSLSDVELKIIILAILTHLSNHFRPNALRAEDTYDIVQMEDFLKSKSMVHGTKHKLSEAREVQEMLADHKKIDELITKTGLDKLLGFLKHSERMISENKRLRIPRDCLTVLDLEDLCQYQTAGAPNQSINEWVNNELYM